MLRIEPALHGQLRSAARRAGLSLNDYCARTLTLAPGSAGAPPPIAAAVEHAAALFRDRLVGVAAFGSWCRGEIMDGSDVDLMVVLDRTVHLGRRLYSRWDGAQIAWQGHPLEPHFVHLPEPEKSVAGLWAEVATDGIVLYERAFTLSRRLGQVRRDITAGRLVRRVVHGQPYWALSVVA